MKILVSPGPLIITFFWISRGPSLRVIVPLTLKTIVSPGTAAAICVRSVPGKPLSAKLVTWSTAAKLAEAAQTQTRKRLPASTCNLSIGHDGLPDFLEEERVR